MDNEENIDAKLEDLFREAEQERRNELFSRSKDITKRYNEICTKAGFKPLPIYFSPSNIPNAVYGRTNTGEEAIYITDILLDILDNGEVAAVLAHEIMHKEDSLFEAQTSKAITAFPYLAAGAGAAGAIFLSGYKRPDGNNAEKTSWTRRGFIGLGSGALAGVLANSTVPNLRAAHYTEFEMRADRGPEKYLGDKNVMASALKKLITWYNSNNVDSQYAEFIELAELRLRKLEEKSPSHYR